MQEFKKWEDLTITDDFMFCKVMSDPDICKELLEILLHIKIERLEFQEPQKREYPLTFTNFEPKLHFSADLSA